MSLDHTLLSLVAKDGEAQAVLNWMSQRGFSHIRGGGGTRLLSVLRGFEVVWRGKTSFKLWHYSSPCFKEKSWENTKLDLHKSSVVKVHQIKPLIVSLQIHSEYEWSPTGAVGKTLLFADWCSVRRSILVLIMMLFCRIGNILPLFKIILLAISKVPKKTFCSLI